MFVYLSAKLPEGNRMCIESAKIVLLGVYNYFDSFEQRDGVGVRYAGLRRLSVSELCTVTCYMYDIISERLNISKLKSGPKWNIF